jgi:hypothetical protein
MGRCIFLLEHVFCLPHRKTFRPCQCIMWIMVKVINHMWLQVLYSTTLAISNKVDEANVVSRVQEVFQALVANCR